MASEIDFHRDIRPILEFNCVSCHQESDDKGGLRMDVASHFYEGGSQGDALVKGDAEASLIVDLVTLPEDDPDVMPPKGRLLHEEEVAKLKQWIQEGAEWPEDFVLIARNEEDFKEAEPLPERDKAITSLDIYPPDINLFKARDSQSVVVVATYDDDTTYDVTANATFTFENPELVDLRTRSHFLPVENGETTLTVTVGDLVATAPVKVVDAEVDRPISYNLDVMPVFMRDGCNTGACHGSARGQDGFMLSLFGYDPEGDHFRLTREMAGYRINLAIPEESLLVEKAIEAVPHTGGKLMERGSHGFNTLVEWIADGAEHDDPAELPTLVDLEVYPPKLVLEGADTQAQLTVRAKFSDGHDRDVTHLAAFVTNNDPTADVDPDGLITAGKRGEAFIMARYETQTVGIQVIVIPEELEYTRPELTENNYIDTYVHEKLHHLRMIPSETCSDEEFLRRVYIDIVGLLPSVEDYRAFMANDSGNKRAELIDELLERKEFTEMWVMKWSELLQVRSNNNLGQGISYKAALLYHDWLRDRISENVPLDQWVVELMSAEGGTFDTPATNFYQVERDALQLSENVAQVFMGFRLQCAQCHNHPFDRWTMDDYYGWAAFFSQIGRKQGVDQRENIIYNRRSGETRHLVGGHNVTPKFLGDEEPELEGRDRRLVAAEWMVSPENPYFSKNVVNIVWSHFYGVGIIDPVDDVRVSNPASNPELLEALAERFSQDYGYDFKQLVRDICNSATYQRSTRANPTNKDDLNNFAKARIRRQRAEVMLDTITQVTDTENKFRGLPLGARAVQIADGNTTDYFLTTFGRATRETVCSCEVEMEPSLSQALHLLNGPTVSKKIEDGGVIKTLLAADSTPGEIIEELYIRTLSRRPTESEQEELLAQVTEVGEDEEEVQMVLSDVFWALLNSKEFMFNH